jgi:hypothetical protein
MRWITLLFVMIAGLILAAAGIGVWAASTTNHANVDTHEGLPVGGHIAVLPPVF